MRCKLRSLACIFVYKDIISQDINWMVPRARITTTGWNFCTFLWELFEFLFLSHSKHIGRFGSGTFTLCKASFSGLILHTYTIRSYSTDSCRFLFHVHQTGPGVFWKHCTEQPLQQHYSYFCGELFSFFTTPCNKMQASLFLHLQQFKTNLLDKQCHFKGFWSIYSIAESKRNILWIPRKYIINQYM